VKRKKKEYCKEWFARKESKKHRLDYLHGEGAGEWYFKMLTKQGGVCAICKNKSRDGNFLHFDHDHVTGKWRGLLCDNCNRTLGMMGDDSDRLLAAARYLMNA